MERRSPARRTVNLGNLLLNPAISAIRVLIHAHHTRHENGGDDEISVTGLSGDLADLQDPKDHTHQSAGSGVGGLLAEAALSLTDVTTNDASTTKHGFVVKATAPAANVLNVVGIANLETAYTNKAIFDGTNPAALGTAAPGTSLIAAHRDHVHSNNIGAATGTSLQLSGLTASEILGTDASKNLVSLAVATYPSLTELSYVKGLSSAVQTQLGLKAPLASPSFTGTVTLPLVTLGGTVTGNSNNITGMGTISVSDGGAVRVTVDNGSIYVFGGTDNNSAGFILRGKSYAGTPGYFELYTPNAGLTAINRLAISGGVATATATWLSTAHTGLIANSPFVITGANPSVLTLGQAGAYDGAINTPHSTFINIDSNNDGTTERFCISKNGAGRGATDGGIELFSLTEAGVATWSSVTQTGLNITTGQVLQVGGTQVVGARVVDARCDDAINSGDATTDGVIDALRDAMISHGLISTS